MQISAHFRHQILHWQTGWVVKRIELRSPLARAVAPVGFGVVVIALIGLLLWGIAALMAGEQAQTTTFTPDRLTVGDVTRWSESISEKGPVLFPGLGTTTGERTLVLMHNGDDPQRGWVVYYAHPADRDVTCAVTQIEETDDFTDCDGRTVNVADLAPPTNGEFPVIEDRRDLYIDLGDRPGDVTTTTPG